MSLTQFIDGLFWIVISVIITIALLTLLRGLHVLYRQDQETHHDG